MRQNVGQWFTYETESLEEIAKIAWMIMVTVIVVVVISSHTHQ